MALITCPECGRENISNMAVSCPGCGYPISHMKPDRLTTPTQNFTLPNIDHNKKNTKNSYTLVIICVAIVAFLIIFLSTRCTLDNCYSRRDRTSSRGYCIYHQKMADRVVAYKAANSYNYEYESTKSIGDLKISNVSVHKTKTTMYCTGTITNNGDKPFASVQVKGAFKNRNNDTIETGSSYAVGSEGLAPGESTSFTIYGDKNDEVEKCIVTVYDYS